LLVAGVMDGAKLKEVLGTALPREKVERLARELGVLKRQSLLDLAVTHVDAVVGVAGARDREVVAKVEGHGAPGWGPEDSGHPRDRHTSPGEPDSRVPHTAQTTSRLLIEERPVRTEAVAGDVLSCCQWSLPTCTAGRESVTSSDSRKDALLTSAEIKRTTKGHWPSMKSNSGDSVTEVTSVPVRADRCQLSAVVPRLHAGEARGAVFVGEHEVARLTGESMASRGPPRGRP